MSATPDRGLQQTTVPMCKIALGFDFGHARIGVAIGDAITGSARPLRVVSAKQQRPDWEAIAQLIAQWQPDCLIVGLPTHADATANPITQAALRFSRQLHGRFRLPVATIDERLSSWEAEQRQSHAQTASGGRRKPVELDATAAALILESWFNHQRSLA
jgi:putative Holliday junction resolvase